MSTNNRKTNVGGRGKVKGLPIGKLERDPNYEIQRPIRIARAQEIAENFDPDQFGIPLISLRDDGQYIILDGQHRIYALKLLGWDGIRKIDCELFEGLTLQEEAGLFLGRNDYRTVSCLDRFLVRLTKEDPSALDIARITQDAGFTIDRSFRPGVIMAVTSLEDIYLGRGFMMKGTNPAALKVTLEAVKQAWGDSEEHIRGTAIKGVGVFFLRFLGKADPKRVASILSKITGGADGLIARGKGKRDLHGGSTASGIGLYLAESYNKGLRGKKRLEK